jgi:hypothetical protein
VDDKDNHQNSVEEEQPESSNKEPTSTEREDVDAAEEGYGVEARDEGPEDAYSGQLPDPGELSEESAYLSASQIASMSTVSPEVASSLAEAEARRAEAAEASRAEAQPRLRELEMQAKQAEWEAAREQSLQEAQVQLEMDRRKQDAEVRKAEVTQIREQNKQQFELQKNKWSIDKMRGVVSLLLVVGFLATTGIVIVTNVTGQAGADMLQTVASLYSGITGAVLGFYFGRQQQ